VSRLLALVAAAPLLLGVGGADCTKLRRELAAAERRAQTLQQRIGDLVALRVSATRARRSADGLRLDPRADAVVRGCESAISGGAEDAGPQDVRVGPLTLRFVRDFASRPRSWFAPAGSDKSIAVVDAGADVTIVVAEGHRDDAALTYLEPAPAVRFTACAGRRTPFSGGFVVAGPRCVPLDVYAGESAAPERVVLSFGAGLCPASGPS
jgi:hypothetical protein